MQFSDNNRHSEICNYTCTVEPLKNGPLKSGQPLYNGHFVWNEAMFYTKAKAYRVRANLSTKVI